MRVRVEALITLELDEEDLERLDITPDNIEKVLTDAIIDAIEGELGVPADVDSIDVVELPDNDGDDGDEWDPWLGGEDECEEDDEDDWGWDGWCEEEELDEEEW